MRRPAVSRLSVHAGEGVTGSPYHVIVYGDILEHLEDPFRIFLDLNRLLSQNGTIRKTLFAYQFVAVARLGMHL